MPSGRAATGRDMGQPDVDRAAGEQQAVTELELRTAGVRLVAAPHQPRDGRSEFEHAPGDGGVLGEALGLSTASATSGMRPSGQRRIS